MGRSRTAEAGGRELSAQPQGPSGPATNPCSKILTLLRKNLAASSFLTVDHLEECLSTSPPLRNVTYSPRFSSWTVHLFPHSYFPCPDEEWHYSLSEAHPSQHPSHTPAWLTAPLIHGLHFKQTQRMIIHLVE